jgi:hypothetical protein
MIAGLGAQVFRRFVDMKCSPGSGADRTWHVRTSHTSSSR